MPRTLPQLIKPRAAHANLAQTSRRKRLPLDAITVENVNVFSNGYRAVLLAAASLGGFEPRRPRHFISISGSLRIEEPNCIFLELPHISVLRAMPHVRYDFNASCRERGRGAGNGLTDRDDPRTHRYFPG